ncbi:MAG: glycosyl hydrolase family 2 [Gemmatimonadetes bacterium]|nr:glycosyl hydrolase family 2 [Gemmatimonadota bacterium]
MKRVTIFLLLLLAAAGPLGAQLRQPLDRWQLQEPPPAGRTHQVTVPATVAGALVDDGTYRDPFFGMNLRTLPGMSYGIGRNFVHTAMDSASPFARPWWYRTTFRLPESFRGRHVQLHLDGVNYRANIFLNGRRIADSAQIAGAYRRHELDITAAVDRSGENRLEVQVYAQTPKDLGLNWVDWNPSPPDMMMGLWHDAYLTATGPVAVRFPYVSSSVDSATLRRAELTVGTLLRNYGDRPVTGTLRGRIGDIQFARPITLAPRDSADVRFTPDSFPQLRIRDPRLWWPAELGEPALHTLALEFEADGEVSDRQNMRFGIREITAEFTPTGAKLFRVNGRRILVRGGGWTPDLFLRPQPERQLAQLEYALDLHLNTIRLEGKLEDDRFWERTDSLGILVMAGWCCCSIWEEWRNWGPEQYAVAAASQLDQVRRLRGHPGALMWLNGSDNPPPADVEKMYNDILVQQHWPNPYLSSASTKRAQLTGPSGVKMTGPYDWVPPSYWLQDSTHGGAWSFNTETSPGAAVPPLESMQKMLPASSLWPLDSVWAYHGAGGQFNQTSRFNVALAARYGEPTDARDYTFKAQLMTYEGQRAMFEAYRRNQYRTTGIIQWMFNNAWPSIFWHLFDWYLRPAGGYFGSKLANEPVHVMYSYDDASIAIVNGRRAPLRDVRLRARVLAADLTERFARDTVLDLPADSTLRLFAIPPLDGLGGTYFLDLRLTGRGDSASSRNFYWLSTSPDRLNMDSTTWYVTPVRSYADYKALRRLPAATLRATVRFADRADEGEARITLENTGKALAFFTELSLRAGGDDVLPITWTDNYVSLLPGETRHLVARYRQRDLRGAVPELVLRGWNVAPQVLRRAP